MTFKLIYSITNQYIHIEKENIYTCMFTLFMVLGIY